MGSRVSGAVGSSALNSAFAHSSYRAAARARTVPPEQRICKEEEEDDKVEDCKDEEQDDDGEAQSGARAPRHMRRIFLHSHFIFSEQRESR